MRHDIERLRSLDYPIEAARGPAGGYRLGAGGRLPPLLLDDDEAVAVAIGLRSAATVPGIEDANSRALAKLEQVLPSRLRPTLETLSRAIEHAPENTATDAPDPQVDSAVLRAIATTVRAGEWFRFDYDDEERLVEPYRLLARQRRWYLVARDPRTGDWDVYRADRIRPRTRTGRRFQPVPIPGGDYAAFAMRQVATSGWNVHARIRIDAPAAKVLNRINPAVGIVEALDDHTCVLATGADTLQTIAAYIGMLDLDFTVESPGELRENLRRLAARYQQAATAVSD